jgi:hypothetical protein
LFLLFCNLALNFFFTMRLHPSPENDQHRVLNASLLRARSIDS